MPKGYLVTIATRNIKTGRQLKTRNMEVPRKREAKAEACRIIKNTPKDKECSITVDCRVTGHTVYETSGNCDFQTVMVDDVF